MMFLVSHHCSLTFAPSSACTTRPQSMCTLKLDQTRSLSIARAFDLRPIQIILYAWGPSRSVIRFHVLIRDRATLCNGSVTIGQQAFYCQRLLSYFTDTVTELEFATRGGTREVVACLCSSRSGTTRGARTDVVGTILAVGEWFANECVFVICRTGSMRDALGSISPILRMQVVSSLHSITNELHRVSSDPAGTWSCFGFSQFDIMTRRKKLVHRKKQ